MVNAARRWLGTPYHHAADVPRVGVDCAMLLVRVFVDSGVIAPFDPRPYTRDWMLHRDDERFQGWVLGSARPISEPQPGDVVLFKVGRSFAHGGVVTGIEPLTMVHAYSRAACVVEEAIDRNPDFAARERLFFSHWGA